MDNGTCIAFLMFYVYRHYKRIGLTAKKHQLISDLKICHTLLKRMEKNVPIDVSIELIGILIKKINGYGANMDLKYPLRYVDIFDSDIIKIMIRLTEEIIVLVKRPFYKRFSGEIFTRFLVLHNLPRALLYESSGDESTPKYFHISKQDALECVSKTSDI